MILVRISPVTLLAGLLSSACAQQLENGALYPAPWGSDAPNYTALSAACQKALNTTVDCPATLAKAFVWNWPLYPEDIIDISTRSCLADLQSARTSIKNTCSASTDVTVFPHGVYPATFLVSLYLSMAEQARHEYELALSTERPVNPIGWSANWPLLPDLESQLQPLAPGTIHGCASYINFEDYKIDPHVSSCSHVAGNHYVADSDLLNWNPSLSRNETDCMLQPEYSYCVLGIDTGAPSFVWPGRTCLQGLTNIQDGTDPNCVCYIAVWGNDSGPYSDYDTGFRRDCDAVAHDANITLSQLTTWNSWLGSDCDFNLYAGMNGTKWRPVCAGADVAAPHIDAAATDPLLTISSPTGTSGTSFLSRAYKGFKFALLIAAGVLAGTIILAFVRKCAFATPARRRGVVPRWGSDL